jgi:uncharacterized protein (UPF0335 family)
VANDFQGLEILIKSLQSDIKELRKDISTFRSLESRVGRNEVEIQRIKDDKRNLWSDVKKIENECARRASILGIGYQKKDSAGEAKSVAESYWHSVWYNATTHGIWILLSAGLSTVITLIITKGGGN